MMRSRLPALIPAMLLAAMVATVPSTLPAAPSMTLQEARRLTWNRATRNEGVDELRRLMAENQESLEIREALGEVLTWAEGTRPEGISLLREVLARDPDRDRARLLLAEVLSWDRDQRGESQRLYREQLARHPEDTAARVGLARLLSWRGDLDASRELYLDAMRRDPGDPAARMGLAEVQRWSGHARAALRTLGALDEDARRLPAARRRLAEAWLDLDRPARALAEYDALLAENPDDETIRRETARLHRRLQPSLEMGAWASTESGDPGTSKVEVLAVPVVWNWGSGRDWRYHADAGVAFYDNQQGATRRLTGGGGARGPLGRRARLRADAAVEQFQDGDSELSGLLELRLAAGDHAEFVLGGRRQATMDSRLSAAGEAIAGLRYGPVFETSAFAGISARPGHGWDMSARATRGSLRGDNTADNDRRSLFAGFGRTLHAGRVNMRPGYGFTYMSYDLDLSGFPPGDLGGDGVTSPGVGGYFSPDRFINHMARLDIWWDHGDGASYSAGGGLGAQQVDDIGNQGLGSTTLSSDIYLGARWRLSPAVDLRARAGYQNVAAAFNRTRAELVLVRRF